MDQYIDLTETFLVIVTAFLTTAIAEGNLLKIQY